MKLSSMTKHYSWKILISCNIKSINCHFQDLILSPKLVKSDVICLQETWMNPLLTESFRINGYNQTFNGFGPGKGIATFYRDHYYPDAQVNKGLYQITKIVSEQMDIINIYRSKGASSNLFV